MAPLEPCEAPLRTLRTRPSGPAGSVRSAASHASSAVPVRRLKPPKRTSPRFQRRSSAPLEASEAHFATLHATPRSVAGSVRSALRSASRTLRSVAVHGSPRACARVPSPNVRARAPQPRWKGPGSQQTSSFPCLAASGLAGRTRGVPKRAPTCRIRAPRAVGGRFGRFRAEFGPEGVPPVASAPLICAADPPCCCPARSGGGETGPDLQNSRPACRGRPFRAFQGRVRP